MTDTNAELALQAARIQAISEVLASLMSLQAAQNLAMKRKILDMLEDVRADFEEIKKMDSAKEVEFMISTVVQLS